MKSLTQSSTEWATYSAGRLSGESLAPGVPINRGLVAAAHSSPSLTLPVPRGEVRHFVILGLSKDHRFWATYSLGIVHRDSSATVGMTTTE